MRLINYDSAQNAPIIYNDVVVGTIKRLYKTDLVDIAECVLWGEAIKNFEFYEDGTISRLVLDIPPQVKKLKVCPKCGKVLDYELYFKVEIADGKERDCYE